MQNCASRSCSAVKLLVAMGGGQASGISPMDVIANQCVKVQGGNLVEPTGLPLWNCDAINHHLAARVFADAIGVSLCGFAGELYDHMVAEGSPINELNFHAKLVFDDMPVELKETSAGETLQMCFETSDWRGKQKYAELKIAGEMHYLFFKSEQVGADEVNFGFLRVTLPSDFGAEYMVAGMIRHGFIGWDLSDKTFRICA